MTKKFPTRYLVKREARKIDIIPKRTQEAMEQVLKYFCVENSLYHPLILYLFSHHPVMTLTIVSNFAYISAQNLPILFVKTFFLYQTAQGNTDIPHTINTVAEKEGFEPSDPLLRDHLLSRKALSTNSAISPKNT